jgi:hypothetical protein
MTHRRVLRYDVPVDDQPHLVGGGRVLHVGSQFPRPTGTPQVALWCEEELHEDWPGSEPLRPQRWVQVFGTGDRLPDAAFRHLGTALGAGLVCHLYEVAPS